MNTEDLRTQIQNDLTKLEHLLSNIDKPDCLDSRLTHLAQIIQSNPGCFITVAPKTLKIRSSQDKRLAKINADFECLPEDIHKHIITNMRSKDIAYMLLLTLRANGMFDIVKFNYKNSNPKAKEISSIATLKERISELKQNADFLSVKLGAQIFKIDDVMTIPNVPKADCALTYRGKQVIFISHKYGVDSKKNPSDCFRQYSGLSKRCLGNLTEHPEVIQFKKELLDGFKNAGVTGMTQLRKGSYFAKRISDKDLGYTTMFGRSYLSGKPSIHNVHVVLQGDMQLLTNAVDTDVSLKGSICTILNPKLFSAGHVSEEYVPHFMATKSIATNQGHEGTRLSVWPLNTTTTKGLDNFNSFFVKSEYHSFKNASS